MSGLLRFLRRVLGPPEHATGAVSRISAPGPDLSRFAEGDRVLIDGKRLSGPLSLGQKIQTPRGFIPHNDIIGKPAVRTHFRSNSGFAHEISYPSLDEYVSLTPRKVTPVYASYASLIVSILDIHVASATPVNDPSSPTTARLEILEAGTGHGSLTLHLSRTIATANASPPSISSDPRIQTDLATAWAEWRSARRAVVHTVEVSPLYRTHAEKIIRGFRQGIYWPHIDFYAANVGDWVASQFQKRKTEAPFLSHVILDMPGVHRQVANVVRAMKEEALLVTFVPSVTQVGDCVREIEAKKLPLVMEKVVELGEGVSNGRIWDVRLVRPKKKWVAVTSSENTSNKEKSAVGTTGQEDDTRIEEAVDQEQEPVFVCRPKVGRMTIGGGFLGVWRKRELTQAPPEVEKKQDKEANEESKGKENGAVKDEDRSVDERNKLQF